MAVPASRDQNRNAADIEAVEQGRVHGEPGLEWMADDDRRKVRKGLDADRIAAAQAALEGDLAPPESDEVPPAMRLHLARVLLGRLLGRLGEGG